MDCLDKGITQFINTKLKEFQKRHEESEIVRLKFVKLFPKNQIMLMQLDDYIVGKGGESFCYWIETKLRELGSIKGGSTADKKFGIYFNKQSGEYRTIPKWDKNLRMDVAFMNIKNAIVNLLDAAERSDVVAISNNPLSPMFKNKILVSYYPEKFLNVFAQEHVDYFIHKLNIKHYLTSHVEEKRQLLIEFKNSNKLLRSFNNYIFMAFLYTWCNPKFKEIRILPMSAKHEFPNKTVEEIQNEFFLKTLINKKKGKYLFRSSGINAVKGALILFQIDNKIIASANLVKLKKYKEPVDVIYKGAYYFDTNTIRVFEPIIAKELSEIDENFVSFSQSKQKLDSSKQDQIVSLINSKERFMIPEEIRETEIDKYLEGTKKQIYVNAYERNAKAREECIKFYGAKCSICEFSFNQIYGDIFDGKIHVHHKVPLNKINDEYEVDPVNDLIPVCPNCHLVLHSKVGDTYTVEEVKEFIKRANNNLVQTIITVE